MKWTIVTATVCFVFAACNKEDNLQQQTNTGNTNTSGVRLSELVFYSDSSFSGTGTDSVAYRIDYTGTAISKMVKVRQHPAAGGVNLYEGLADSILFTYNGTQLSQRQVYRNGAVAKNNNYTYTSGNVSADQEQGFNPAYTGTTNHYYNAGNRYHDYGVFSNGFKDSAYYTYNGSGDMNSNYGHYNFGTGWANYGYTLTYTSQANALRTLINNDVLLATMLGGGPGVQPSAQVPDSLNMAYSGIAFYKRKVVQQIHSSGYIQRMINYYHRPFMRLANAAVKLPYVLLKYDNL
jgi:hypothetical protein